MTSAQTAWFSALLLSLISCHINGNDPRKFILFVMIVFSLLAAFILAGRATYRRFRKPIKPPAEKGMYDALFPH